MQDLGNVKCLQSEVIEIQQIALDPAHPTILLIQLLIELFLMIKLDKMSLLILTNIMHNTPE